MKRREFSRKTKAQAFLRCEGHCEGCGAHLKVGEAEFDHIKPCEFEGDNSLQNVNVLCKPCHRAKTRGDVRAIRKSDRQRDKHSGAYQSRSPMPGGRRSKWKRKISGEVVER